MSYAGDNNAPLIVQDITPAECAERALKALDHYLSDDDDPVETKLTDLLADLMHLADQNGIDFDLAILNASCHHRDGRMFAAMARRLAQS